MKYKKIECNNYDIYLVKTNKFKTISIKTLLIDDYSLKDITKEKFISEFLLSSTKSANTEVLLSKKYMEYYEPSFSINDLYRDVHMKSYSVTFLNEKYTEKGMNKKTIDFYYELLFNPNVVDNKLEIDNFNIIKESLYSAYLRDEEDSSDTAFFHALSNIDADIPLKIDFRGNKEDLMNLDSESLYEYYKNKINKYKFTVFVIGDYSDDIVEYIKNNLDNKVSNNNYEVLKYFNITESKKEREIIEDSNFKQSIIYIIYKIINMTDFERNFVSQVLNNVLGGSSSKLFNNVREKNSLAYYAYSDIYPSNNILYMYAGISKDNYEEAKKLMMNQLNEIINGNITDEEIVGAKESIYSSLLKTSDSQGSIINNLIKHIVFDGVIYDEVKENIEKVTKEDIITLAKKLNLDLIYLLKGEK